MMCCARFRFFLLAFLVALLTTACGGGGTGSVAVPPVTPALDNAVAVRVDTGPADAGYNVNRLYVDLKICRPGSAECQTVDHVLLDTGSTGLRLLSSALSPSLSLTRLTGASGYPWLNCVQFVDNTFAWGPMVTADIVLGGKTASNVPMQIIADPSFGVAPGSCSVGGTATTNSANLGANGILGLGLFREDCGADCAGTTHNGSYYTCTSASCTNTTGAKASLAQQLTNPVTRFASDSNGFVIELPAATGAANSLTGSLIFGIGTQANNQPTAVRALTTTASGYFTTLLGGQSMVNSFLDTGSNGYFFDSSVVRPCTGSGAGFYCPDTLTPLSATLVGVNDARSTVLFSVGDASTMFGDASKAVFPNLAGPMGDATSFDWGLPFFYGRRVWVGIEGQTSALGTGPYYAF